MDGKAVVRLNDSSNEYETIWDWIAAKLSGSQPEDIETLTVVNPRKTAALTVTKTVNVSGLTDSETDAFYNANIKGVKYDFELYIDGEKAQSFQLADGESRSFALPYGSSYEVREVVGESSVFSHSLSTNATGTVDEQAVLDGIAVEAVNSYKFICSNELELNMLKVSAGAKRTALKGAKFALYDSEGAYMASYVSGSDGRFTVAEITAPGEYALKETAAPEGYYPLNRAIDISAKYAYSLVDDNGSPVVVRTLQATVYGRTVYDIGVNSYGIKNSPLSHAPMTGDDSNLLMWLGLAVLSLVSMGTVSVFALKKKGKHQH